jgi:hypothetical protein
VGAPPFAVFEGWEQRISNPYSSGSKPKFNYWSETFRQGKRTKLAEKLRHMRRNPVRRGLVKAPGLWAWSSFQAYPLAEKRAW